MNILWIAWSFFLNKEMKKASSHLKPEAILLKKQDCLGRYKFSGVYCNTKVLLALGSILRERMVATSARVMDWLG